jgi:hypothetical protein
MKIVIFILCIWSLTSVGIIELLNSEAGNILPRKIESTEGSGSGKWRTFGQPEYQIPRMIYSEYKSEHELPFDAPLSNIIKNELQPRIDNLISQSKTENALKGYLGSIGLLQYPLAIFLLLFGKSRHKSYIGKFCLLCAFISLSFALYRGYFTSLGLLA